MGGHRTQVPALGASGGLPLRSGSGSGENESTSGLADWGGFPPARWRGPGAGSGRWCHWSGQHSPHYGEGIGGCQHKNPGWSSARSVALLILLRILPGVLLAWGSDRAAWGSPCSV